MLSLANVLLVALGGAFGSVCRYLLGVRLFKAFGPGLPYGTFAANLFGGLLMGVLVGVLALRGGGDQERWRLLLGVGVLGGFTTFSAFSFDLFSMIQRGQPITAFGYALVSVVGALLLFFAGWGLARAAA